MSLESAIAANTTALKDFTQAVLSLSARPSAAEAEGAPLPPAPAPTPPYPTGHPTEPKPAAIKPPADAVVPLQLDYLTEVKPRIIALAGAKDADAVREMLKEFGVTRGQDLKPAQYAAVVDRINASLPH